MDFLAAFGEALRRKAKFGEELRNFVSEAALRGVLIHHVLQMIRGFF
jgi:hypothetical protein